MADSLAERAFFAALGKLKFGSLQVENHDGGIKDFSSGISGPHGHLRVNSASFYRRMLAGGEIAFGEMYQQRICDSSDLVSLLRLAIVNRQAINLNKGFLKLFSRKSNRSLHRRRANTMTGSRDNIHAHYDLGNAFFATFLDETLTYSSAIFETEDQSLKEAQQRKYQRMCELAELGPGDHVLEIGTGWGGFAMYAAENFGCKVTTITISQEQFNLARERIAAAQLDGLIDVNLVDYRDVSGTFDKIVSIEMFEAVGAEFFEIFFIKSAGLLNPGGKLVMQVITVPDDTFEAQVNGVNWIQKYIFPGGVLPSLPAMERANAQTGLVVTKAEDIGLHYATTLHRWRDSFWDRIDEVKDLGYDDYFIRTWDYYLAACEAGFLTKNTGDIQVVFEKPRATS